MNFEAQLHHNLKILRHHCPSFLEQLGDIDSLIQQTQQYTYGPYHFDFTQPYHQDSSRNPFDPHLQSFANQQSTAIDQALKNGARLLVFSGIGIGHLMPHIQKHFSLYPNCAVIICEPNTERWAAALRCFSFEFIIHTQNLYIFGGASAKHNAIEFIRANYLYLLASNQTKYLLGTLLQDPEETAPYIQMAKDIAASSQQFNVKFEETLDQFHNIIAIKPKSPKTIWIASDPNAYIHFPIAKALLSGFAENGFDTMFESFDDPFASPMRITGRFIEHPPDLILSLNCWPSLLLEDLGMNAETVKSIKRHRVCWMVDNTSMYENVEQSELVKHDWVFCNDHTFLPWLKTLTKHAHFLPVATTINKPGAVRDTLKAAISYAGSLPNLFEYFNRLTDDCLAMMEEVETLRSEDYTKSFYEHWHSLQPDSNQKSDLLQAAQQFVQTTQKQLTNGREIVEYFLYNAATFFKRKKIIKSLLPIGLVVYGPESWKEVLPTQYKDRYRGFMPNEHLADCYTSSQINLNIHSHQRPTSLNERDVDVPMAGGVVLCDWVEDIDAGYMQEGKELAVYRSVDELPDVVNALLNDQDKQESIRQAGQRRVQNEHTFAHRAASILEYLDYKDQSTDE